MKVQKSFKDEGGKLYLVATPIGNLEDMTFRAIRTLKEADWIAAEDTRQTRKLLTHYEITGRLVSYHEHNKQASGPELIRLMKDGATVALVSDAGLPAISDPGYDLVVLASENQIPIVPIPGANAALSALIVSGLSTERFTFIGFLPRDKKELKLELEKIKHRPETLLCYESPHRLVKTLEHMQQVWGNRRLAMVRELTKRHEEVSRGTLQEALTLLEQHPPLGEYCLIIEGNATDSTTSDDASWWCTFSVEQHVMHYESLGENRKDAMKKTAVDRGVSKRDIYNQLLE